MELYEHEVLVWDLDKDVDFPYPLAEQVSKWHPGFIDRTEAHAEIKRAVDTLVSEEGTPFVIAERRVVDGRDVWKLTPEAGKKVFKALGMPGA
ncbi:hypothetical protein KGD83_03665 [Nocardiopsis akebiae]|uniref:Uncharacterized protein n=1 Tax=Nocardiopsis akebiae TaxID=2831968 RepID=A0ABX8C5J0_9ACTN|nr:hypothetical protein [Nocardiopsis akebiae]QUX29686.1 hypothetical protein KGD83_03665 [Nocardiopsis akebiae]